MGNICHREKVNQQLSVPGTPRFPIFRMDVSKHYKIKSRIGSGYFSTVKMAYSRTNKDHWVAIKSIQKRKVKKINHFVREVEILQGIDHINIIKLYGHYENSQYYHIVMEYCSGGELLDKVIQKKRLKENEAAQILKQIFKAVNHLHSLGICHRDLKPDNFLFKDKSGESVLKLIDFGLSQRFGFKEENCMNSVVGTPHYAAPEVLAGIYSNKCDLWSCGVIMYCLLTGKFPFAANNTPGLLYKIQNKTVKFNSPNWKRISQEAIDLVKNLLNKNPSKRLSAGEVLKHPWLKRIRRVKCEFNLEIIDSWMNFHCESALKRAALEILVQRLSSREIAQLSAFFDELDIEKQGFLSLSDIRTALVRAGYNPVSEQIEEIMKKSDAARDGRINYTEFVAATLKSRNLLDQEHVWDVFRVFDPDDTGQITVENLRAALINFGRPDLNPKNLIKWKTEF